MSSAGKFASQSCEDIVVAHDWNREYCEKICAVHSRRKCHTKCHNYVPIAVHLLAKQVIISVCKFQAAVNNYSNYSRPLLRTAEVIGDTVCHVTQIEADHLLHTSFPNIFFLSLFSPYFQATRLNIKFPISYWLTQMTVY
jgi:hypothetical protein